MARQAAVATDERRMVPSKEAEARVVPSGLTATVVIACVCPENARRKAAVATSRRRTG